MGFNCTFMELKWTEEEEDVLGSLRFNCTFMELKFLLYLDKIACATVLIVPLWN